MKLSQGDQIETYVEAENVPEEKEKSAREKVCERESQCKKKRRYSRDKSQSLYLMINQINKKMK